MIYVKHDRNWGKSCYLKLISMMILFSNSGEKTSFVVAYLSRAIAAMVNTEETMDKCVINCVNLQKCSPNSQFLEKESDYFTIDLFNTHRRCFEKFSLSWF